MIRTPFYLVTATLLGLAAWLGASGPDADSAGSPWRKVDDGVYRSRGFPCAYALIDDGRGVVIGAARGADLDALRPLGAATIDQILLTHHHRDSCAQAREWVAAGRSVVAPKASATWITPDNVRKYWTTSLPVFDPANPPGLRDRSFGVWDDLVLPEGIEGVESRLADGETIAWKGWTIAVVGAPGHSRDHTAFLATRGARKKPGFSEEAGLPGGRSILFCGDALASAGTMPTPYTTDWHHCFNDGLDAAVASLKKLAALDAAVLCPEQGLPISGAAAVKTALEETARRAAEAGKMKSYEWYTKERVGEPPQYRFLAPDQVATAGEKPWTQLSPHLYLTGNTYVLASKDGPMMVIDPFGAKITEQIDTLRGQFALGPIETAVISHAHNDHYTGVFQLADRERWQVWTLADVAAPLREPFRFRAPYLDPRPVKVDRVLKDGEVVAWREYEFRVSHFPGQTLFTMGLEATIDGKRCFHTADNFFHADQFTGSGGWSGRNRSWPLFYADSARQVLRSQPEWVLAEHGGPFVFDAEDFRRRVSWGDAAGKAADALCPSGHHRHDWDPQRVCVEPLLHAAKAGSKFEAELVATNHTAVAETLVVQTEAGSPISAGPITVTVSPHETVRRRFTLALDRGLSPGRRIVPLTVTRTHANAEPFETGGDVFCVVDVAKP